MKWIDLYSFLVTQANEMKNIGKFDWQSDVVVFDKNTGDYYNCDLLQFTDQPTNDVYVSIDTQKQGQ